MQTHEIRKRFTEHFVKAGHTEVPSAPLILDDPNLLFVNAGMVPFKPYFLGQQTPSFKTATSIQKCVRTLDIDEVGITTRHNTFFQMAGNFSFGDYFKEGAIAHAWSLLTDSVEAGGFGIDPDRLWATVYQDDDEAARIWTEVVGLPAERLQRRGMKDNYWSMGVPGPCGPSSEIFYDRGPDYGVEGGPEADEDRYIEIWNLVFMENERGEGRGKDGFEIVGALPKKNIDTGMGIERVAFLLQGVENVYETDLLRPVIDTAARLTGATYGESSQRERRDAVHFRVIADHSRTAAMLILDGVTPGNEGRGYILRRLLRRIIRSARLLGAQGEVLTELMATVRDAMGPSYPDLVVDFERILSVARGEEASFLRTLESGTRLFDSVVAQLRSESTMAEGEALVLPGDQAFALHDTHGFPIDLTVEMAAEQGLTVDTERFTELMNEQKARAKADSQAKKHGHADLSVYREYVDHHPTEFTGFDTLTSEATVLGVLRDGQTVPVASQGEEVEVVLDRTPLYAEAGGQLGDRGRIVCDSGTVTITDVQKIAKSVWVHRGTVTSGEVHAGSAVSAEVDPAWRRGATQAHSGTHLVHAALRSVLGPDATQAGSLNRPGYLRFDFHASTAVTERQLADIADIVAGGVDDDLEVETEETTLDDAKARGALALFGENYGKRVRMVSIGGDFSRELCGGTHVARSSQIGPLLILGESSVGSGVRRIEAVVGRDAARAAAERHAVVTTLAANLKARPDDLVERVAAQSERLREVEKELAEARTAAALASAASLADSTETVGGVRFLAATAPEGISGQDLRTLATDLRERVSRRAGEEATSGTVVVLIAADAAAGKAPFVIALDEAATSAGLTSSALVAALSEELGARGGGRPDLAQGSGTRPDNAEAALAAVRASLAAR